MYTEIEPVIPTYLVQTTKDSFCYVEAGRCSQMQNPCGQ